MVKIVEKIKQMPLTHKVSVAYAISSILQTCLSFITMPIFTRLLTTEEYGQCTIYSSWKVILSIFITLNLSYGSFSTAMVKFEDKRDEYVATVQGITVFLGVVFLLLYMPMASAWNKIFELPTKLVLLMVFEIVTNMSILCYNAQKRFEFKYKSVILISIIMSFVSPIISLVLIKYSSQRGYAKIVGAATVVIIVGLVIFFINYNKGRRLYNTEFWKYALGFNIPLIPYYLSQTIFNQSDRIMISHLSGIDKAGIYGVAYTLSMILTFVLNAINNSYQPWFYMKLKDNAEYENRKVSNNIALLMAVLLLAVIITAPEIILVMAGNEYMEAVWIVPAVAGSVLLLLYSQYSINVEFYYEKKRTMVLASCVSAIVNIILNAFFIPRFSYIIAGYTTWVSYVIFAVVNYLELKKIIKEKKLNRNLYDVKYLLCLFIIFTIVSFSILLLYNFIIIRYVILIILGLAGLKYFKDYLADNKGKHAVN